MKKYFNCGQKVKFKKTYDGYFEKQKDKIFTVEWHHTEAESGENGGRVKLKELMSIETYHSINPIWLEEV